MKNKSNFIPPKNRNQSLDKFKNSVENIPLTDEGREIKHNLTKHYFGWLFFFWFSGPLRQYFSLYRAVSQREGERGDKNRGE